MMKEKEKMFLKKNGMCNLIDLYEWDRNAILCTPILHRCVC